MTLKEIQHLEPFAGFLSLYRAHFTRIAYAQVLRGFLLFLGEEGVTVGTATRAHLLRFAASLSMDGFTPSGKVRIPYGAATIIHSMAAVRKFYDYLFAIGYLKDNPASVLSLVKVRKPERLPRPLQPAQRLHLLQALRADTLLNLKRSLAIRLGYECGLRISETTGALVDRIDLEAPAITVIGKGDKERTVPMTKSLRDWIAYYLRKRNVVSPYLFPTPWDPSRHCMVKVVAGWINFAGLWAGIDHLTGHVLRHTFGTQLAESGASSYEIRDLMGHATTLQTETYVRIASDAPRLAHARAFKNLETKEFTNGRRNTA